MNVSGNTKFYRLQKDDGTCAELQRHVQPRVDEKQHGLAASMDVEGGRNKAKLVRITNLSPAFPTALSESLISAISAETQEARTSVSGHTLSISFVTSDEKAMTRVRKQPVQSYEGFHFSVQVLDIDENISPEVHASFSSLDAILSKLNPQRKKPAAQSPLAPPPKRLNVGHE
jgi:hypothetical protein